MMKHLDAVDKTSNDLSILEIFKPTSRLDAADDDVVDFIVSDLLVATSKNID
jgi:hypothetical protein